jgi:hypothetical protein
VTWEEYVKRITFRVGKVTLVNYAGGDPHFEFEIMVYDSVKDEWRPLTIIEGISNHMIRYAQPDDPRRCVVVGWFHRQFRRMFIHECDEYFMFDGVRIFNPHDPETRLTGVIY